MLSSLALPAEIRVQLETARRILGLSQADLSNLAGISQGNVSNCLQGRSVRVDSLHRLISAFAAAAASSGERGIPPEHAAEIQKIVETARRAVDGALEPTGSFSRPGGAIPENAINRLERIEEHQLIAALDDAPFVAAVTGPPECGKSTLLQLLVSAARRRGFAVTEFDGNLILPVEDTPAEEDAGRLSQEFFRELAAEVGRTIGESPKEDVTTRFELARFLREVRLRRPAPPLLIILDHASHISLALEEVIQVCRSLDAQKGRTQMSWVLEASDLPGDNLKLGLLSRLQPSPLVIVGWFTPEQVQKLSQLHGMKEKEHIEALWEWFSGQPFLTHVALNRFRELFAEGQSESISWANVNDEIAAGEGDFSRHLTKMQARLQSHRIWKKDAPWTLDRVKKQMGEDSAFLMFTEQFGVAFRKPKPDSPPRVMKFYAHHLTRL